MKPKKPIITTDSCAALPKEMDLASKWASAHLINSATPPFSFIYGGRPSQELLPSWTRKDTSKKLDPLRTQHVATYTDPLTGLSVRAAAVVYRDFPVVEWTVFLKNTGKRDTPIIENFKAVDACLTIHEFAGRSKASPVNVHYHVGSPCTAEDYKPLVAKLVAGEKLTVATSGGRPCNAHMPFFNVEAPTHGVIMAIGWPGQWKAEFRREKNGGLRLAAGQELTHFTLHPGETVRSPLMALLFYQGDRVRSQNLWRRWMIAHSMPRPGGAPPAPILSAMAWLYFAPWGSSNAQALKVFLDTYEFHKIPLDAWWIDAGWYNCDASLPVSGYSTWDYTGTWTTDRRRFPNGVAEVSAHALKKGLKTMLWFEPERVKPGTWLAEKHPEWLLSAPVDLTLMNNDGTNFLVNLGNPDARSWMSRHLNRILKQEGIAVYREDFNLDPLAFWRANDPADRQGITEIKHIEGHLALWDDLQRHNPGLLIDVCASGGRRNELEALRRAVPLWRSDYAPALTPQDASGTSRLDANQSMTYGIAAWIPYFGTGLATVNTYQCRSSMGSSLAFDLDLRRHDLDLDLWRRLCSQFKQLSPYYLGDYYPLTGYSLDNTVWMAWQFDCPEKGEGMVQVFRREKCAERAVTLRLRGLQPEAAYAVTDIDRPEVRRFSGRELMENGLRLEAGIAPTALVFVYKQLK